jgi:ankyrin repeat protein
LTDHISHSLSCNLNFQRTVLESAGEMPKRIEMDRWRNINFSRFSKISPSLASEQTGNQATPDEPIVTFNQASQSMDSETEKLFFRRVHHITEYVVPRHVAANHFGHSRLPLIQATGQGNVQWVRDLLLRTDTDPNCRSFQGWTALQQACEATKGDPKAVVELLIANGADVNAVPGDDYAMTALQAACEAGNEEVVDILLRKGAGINAQAGPIGGKCAVAAASWSGHMGIVKKLLDLGADVNQCGGKDLGRTALSAAAQRGNLEMIDYLVQRGAELHTERGSEALERAVRWNQFDVASRLLELGVDVNAEVDGQTPIDFVESSKMLNLLVTNGAQLNRPCLRPKGPTALQLAAYLGNLDLVRELIQLGADVHATGPEIRGKTALQCAAFGRWNALPVVQALIDEYGLDVDEARALSEGYTSLEGACHATCQNDKTPNLAVVELLLDRGAKVTPFTLHVAAAWGHTALAQTLLRHGAAVDRPSDIEIVIELWGDDRELGSTAAETAKLNGFPDVAEMLKDWIGLA